MYQLSTFNRIKYFYGSVGPLNAIVFSLVNRATTKSLTGLGVSNKDIQNLNSPPLTINVSHSINK